MYSLGDIDKGRLINNTLIIIVYETYRLYFRDTFKIHIKNKGD